jgi:cysteine desulfurase family protein (TIGR01976 family)
MSWNPDRVRAAFPSLSLTDEGKPRIYLDAPAGSQVPSRVVDRMADALINRRANEGGLFRTSEAAGALVIEAHEAAAAFLGAGSYRDIVFGLNTTSLLFNFSRMIARAWNPGDEIVLSRMDHDANVAPWLIAAEERGVTVRWLEFDTESFEYRYDTLSELIGPKTKLVACNYASNILGTVNDAARIVEAAKSVGAISVVDAVQFAPHLAMDVEALGCDMLACSAYKFFGPHAGVLFVRETLRDRLTPLKVRPSSDEMPTRFSPGTPSFEAQAGTTAAIEHLAWLGTSCGGASDNASLAKRARAGLEAATSFEMDIMRRFLAGLSTIKGVTLYGIADGNRLARRVPTFSFRLPGKLADDVALGLAQRNIFCWSGNFYALEAAKSLGVNEEGVVRVGFSHYNSLEEVDALIEALGELAA